MRHKAPRARRITLPGGGPAAAATVVVGLDGSDRSWAALCWACEAGRRLGARLVAVALCPAGHLLAEMGREASGAGLAIVDACGDPVTALLEVAEDAHADLIVVGRSARAGRLGGCLGRRLVTRRGAPVVAIVP
ncbi:MAG TPA: universal stress protein [Streptosporangiaceae bacterium]|jgi:nucleotide-binding universal stress UspA family protein|nr:universal stress protein [Streptosporangiaceae bacterium]